MAEPSRSINRRKRTIIRSSDGWPPFHLAPPQCPQYLAALICILVVAIFSPSAASFELSGGSPPSPSAPGVSGGHQEEDQQLLLLRRRLHHQPSIPHHGRCEPIRVDFCKDLLYNETMLPNLLGHQSQEDAAYEVRQYFPLIKVHCSKDLKFFLCSVYMPICTILEETLPPCRSICFSARRGCEALMNKFGYRWPDSLDCAHFPADGSGALCAGDSSSSTSNHGNGKSNGRNGVGGQSSLGGWAKGPGGVRGGIAGHENYTSRNSNNHNSNSNNHRELAFVCPIQYQASAGLEHVFPLNGTEHRNCGIPCEGVLFTDQWRATIRIWTGSWAFLCLGSTLFTVLTFLVDTRRFQYPERPIIFLSLCYFFVALVYVAGFLLGDRVACDPPGEAPTGRSNVQMVATVAQGNRKESCTLLFMTLYFFTMSAATWWVILTLTWFLAAGLKWSPEAIEGNSPYFHFVAWFLPAAKTITVLTMGKLGGDVHSGVCFVGFWEQGTQRTFVLYPLLIYLILGAGMLLIGFISLWRIRGLMKMDGTKTDKLEKLMIRIGLFSLVYMLPTMALIGCYIYEQLQLDGWMLHWLSVVCKRREFAIACPPVKPFRRPVEAPLELFLAKYVASLFPGIGTGLWIWSEKTLLSWSNFCRKCGHGVVLLCCGRCVRPGSRPTDQEETYI